MNECLMTPQHEKQIGYWVSVLRKEGKKEGNVLFNDALNTFYLLDIFCKSILKLKSI